MCNSIRASVLFFLAGILVVAANLASAKSALVQTAPTGPAQRALPGQLPPPLSLSLPQSTAFTILGHSCGGIHEHAYVTGFDASGFPAGFVHLTTTCSAGGIGGHSVTYNAWASVTWDFAGNVLAASTYAGSPTVDPAFAASDAYGDQIYNTSTSAFLRVPVPGRPIGVTAVQVSDDFHVTWTPHGANPAAIASTSVTATPVGSSAPVLSATVNGAGTSAVVTTLQPQTTYLITVVSTTVGGTGPASIAISVTSSPATQPPGAPTTLNAVWTNQNPSGSTDTILATWHAADPGNSPIDQYQIKIVDVDTNASFTQTVSGTSLSASFVEDWNPDWVVTVKAHNAAGWGPWSSSFLLGGL